MSNVLKYINVNTKEKKIIQNDYKLPRATYDLAEGPTDIYRKGQVDTSLNDAEKKAEEIILSAEKQAIELINSEKAKIENWWIEKRSDDANIQEEASQRGYQEGYQKGHIDAEAQIKEEYAEIFLKAKQLLDGAYQMKNQIIQDSETVILELSLAIAKKIVNKEIDIDPSIVKEMIKVVLKNIKENEQISLFVNPEYFSYVQVAKEELLAELNGQVDLLIYPDPSVISGGCLVKTSSGTIDAKVDTQLDEIKKILFDVASRRENE